MRAEDAVAIAKSFTKKFVEETLSGMTTIKGANCQISDVEILDDGNSRVTFLWKDNYDVEHTSYMVVNKGADGINGTDGVGIETLYIDDDLNLIVVLDNGTVVSAGEVPKQPLAISEEEGNAIVQKADGLYVSTTGVRISEEANNALEEKEDGLFVEKVTGVEISTEEGNILEQKEDGLYARETDISGLATKQELEGKLDTSVASNTYATKQELGDKLDSTTAANTYATKQELTNGLSGKVDNETLDEYATLDDLNDYALTDDLDAYESKEELAQELENYATKQELSGKLDSTTAANTYATKTELEGKLDSTTAANTYATKTELGNKLDSSVAANTYATKQELGDKLDSTTAASTYATKTELEGKLDSTTAESTYSTKTELANRVKANQGEGTTDLTSLQIGDDIYKIPTGGGGASVENVAMTTYYVSNSGNDNNDGLTTATAFKTIEKALSVCKDTRLYTEETDDYLDRIYLNKGETYTVGKLSIICKKVQLRARGSGANPIILSTATDVLFNIIRSKFYLSTIDIKTTGAGEGLSYVFKINSSIANITSSKITLEQPFKPYAEFLAARNNSCVMFYESEVLKCRLIAGYMFTAYNNSNLTLYKCYTRNANVVCEPYTEDGEVYQCEGVHVDNSTASLGYCSSFLNQGKYGIGIYANKCSTVNTFSSPNTSATQIEASYSIVNVY